MKFKIQNSKFKIILLLTAYSLQLTALSGCEAFRKKFVRKPKKEKEIRVITQTQEYLPSESTEARYRKSFMFWRIAHDELVNTLATQEPSRKRRVFAAKKIIVNLEQMRQFLLPEKQKELDIYISRQKEILKQLDKLRLNRVQILNINSTLKKQKRSIQEVFDYGKIQEYLVNK